MAINQVVEGTGLEIADFAVNHPSERFRLVPVSVPEYPIRWGGPDPETWNEVMEFIHARKGTLRSLPLEATSTEALYD